MNIQTIESSPLSPTDPKDYRRGTLFGSVIAVIGMFFGLVALFGIIIHGREMHLVPILVAIASPASCVLIGLLIIGRAKLALWLMYLLAADLVYSFLLQVAHALKTRRRDDLYGTLFDLVWVGLWLSIVMYFHNRRRMFIGLWGSLTPTTTTDRTIHGDSN
jgi:Ca2+/Na+ antiporter